MFLTFQKLTTATPSKTSRILVNADRVFYLETDTLENRELQTLYDATRVEVHYFPKYTFYTLTTLDDVLNYLPYVDLTGGVGVGSGDPCTDPSTLSFVYAAATYPIIKANFIYNKDLTQLQALAFRPEHLVLADEVTYLEASTGTYKTGLRLFLLESSPREVLLALDFDDLETALDAVNVT